MEHRDRSPFPNLPRDAVEQLRQLPPLEEQEGILARLFQNVDTLLTGSDISIDRERSSSRVKTWDRITAKLRRRGVDKLILDVYGIQLILPEDHIYPALHLIQEAYPTPEEFPEGVPSLRDYNDPTNPWNPLRQEDYHAVHMNIVFTDGVRTGIAEIQLMTAEQQEAAIRNREAYYEVRRFYENLF